MTSASASASLPPSAAADSVTTYLARLASRVDKVRTTLCLGIDPDPEALPRGWPRDASGAERLADLILDACLEHAAAVKINLAFFEAFGSAGIAAVERVRARIPADVPFIADVKRGDIGSTAARQAVALFDVLDAHAVTGNPYLGREAAAPFLDRPERFVYVVCRTSNPGAAKVQNLPIDDEPLYLHVARDAAAWSGADNVGLVVGATAPDELARIRATVPQLPFLVPGVGAQGGDADAVNREGPATEGGFGDIRGGGLLVNVSRGIASAALGAPDPEMALAAAASEWAHRFRC